MKDRREAFFWLIPRESGLDVDQGPSAAITSPTMFGPVLVWSQ